MALTLYNKNTKQNAAEPKRMGVLLQKVTQILEKPGVLQSANLSKRIDELSRETHETLGIGDVEALYQRFAGKVATSEGKGTLLSALRRPLTIGSDRTGSARVLADLLLRARESDGKLTRDELVSAEQEMVAAGLSADEARLALQANLGIHRFPKRLRMITIDAITYVRSGIGKMNDHLAQCEAILQQKLGRACLIDADFDGKLSEADLVAIKQPDGSVTFQQVDSNALRTSLRAEVVGACHEMAKAKHDFATLEGHRANPTYFTVRDDGTFILKLGVKASDAMNDIFNHPTLYAFECATALIIVYYRALQHAIGDEDFDRICPDLALGPWQHENHLMREVGADSGGPLSPGEYAYFKNFDVSAQGEAAGWQGENVIYLGDGYYYGHPFRVTKADNIVAKLNGFRRADSQTSAALLPGRSDLSPWLLSHDKIPHSTDFVSGALAYRQGHYDEAVVSLRKAAIACPQDGRVWLLLAQALERAQPAGSKRNRAEMWNALDRAIDLGALRPHELRFQAAPLAITRPRPVALKSTLAKRLNEQALSGDFAGMNQTLGEVQEYLRQNTSFDSEELAELTIATVKCAEVAEACSEWSTLGWVLRILGCILTLGGLAVYYLLEARDRERVKRFSRRLQPEVQRMLQLDDVTVVLNRATLLPPSLTHSLTFAVRVRKMPVGEALLSCGTLTAGDHQLSFGQNGTARLDGREAVYSVGDDGTITVQCGDCSYQGFVDSLGVLHVSGLGDFAD